MDMEARLTERLRILLVAGSTRRGSSNVAALRAARDEVQDGVTAVMFEGLADLPGFNPDDDHEPLPRAVTVLRDQIGAADGVLFCTPEYAGGLPGTFKNLLDWTVGGSEMDGKPVAWINVAAEGRGLDAQRSLARVMGYVGAAVVEPAGRRVFVARDMVDPNGVIVDVGVRAEIEDAVHTFVGQIDQVDQHAIAATAAPPPDRQGRTLALRVARHTDRLAEMVAFYRDGIGLTEIGDFRDHNGYDGVFLAVPGTGAHLELTTGGRHSAPPPHPESLLVFYLGDDHAVQAATARLGLDPVVPANPYWADHGVTVQDPDGFGVVLVPESWQT
jgi:NAD(P)H-dependent FMN reductase